MSENRIPGAALIRPPRRTAAGDGFHMAIFCSALGNHQIVKSIPFIKMGPLDTFHRTHTTPASVPSEAFPSPNPKCFGQSPGPLARQRCSTNTQSRHHQKTRKGQFPFGSPKSDQTILLGYRLSTHKIPFAAHIGCHHIETAFMVTNGRSQIPWDGWQRPSGSWDSRFSTQPICSQWIRSSL